MTIGCGAKHSNVFTAPESLRCGNIYNYRVYLCRICRQSAEKGVGSEKAPTPLA